VIFTIIELQGFAAKSFCLHKVSFPKLLLAKHQPLIGRLLGTLTTILYW